MTKLDPESLVVTLQDLACRLGSSLFQPLVAAAVVAAFEESAVAAAFAKSAAAAFGESVAAAFGEPVIVAMESAVVAAVA